MPIDDSRIRQILLVEDDRFLRRACEASLRQRGFAVTTATDGEEALRLVEQSVPDLILLDLLMPKLTGIEVLRRLRAEASTRAVPILVLSNSSREDDVHEVTKLGVTGYLIKANLSLQELADRVTQVLNN